MKRKLKRLYDMYAKSNDQLHKEQEFCRIIKVLEDNHAYEIINHRRIKNKQHLYSICREAVWDALEQYDPSKSSLYTYINVKIRWKIKRECYNQSNDMFIIQIPYHAMVAYNNVYGKIVAREEVTGDIGRIGFDDIECEEKDYEKYAAVDRFIKQFDRRQCVVVDDNDETAEAIVGVHDEIGEEDIHYDYVDSIGMADIDDERFATEFEVINDIAKMKRSEVMEKHGINKHQLAKKIHEFKKMLENLDE